MTDRAAGPREPSEPEVRGGQLWSQPELPCFTVYMVSGRDGFLAISDPREQGSMVVARITDTWHDGQWWGEYFAAHGYALRGQLRDVETAMWDRIIGDYQKKLDAVDGVGGLTPPNEITKLVTAVRTALAGATPAPWRVTLGSGLNQCTALMHEQPDGTMLFVADFCPDYALDAHESRPARNDHLPDMHLVENAPMWLAQLCAIAESSVGGLTVERLTALLNAAFTDTKLAMYFPTHGLALQVQAKMLAEWLVARLQKGRNA
jgi:hypothetical protein